LTVKSRLRREVAIGISTFQEVAQVCEQIQGHTHVVALGHVYGKGEIDAVYAHCGARWPQRSHEQFHNTFTEHWRAQRSDPLMATMTP